MRRLFSILCLGLLAGCSKPSDTFDSLVLEPTAAQPKLPTIRLYIGQQVIDAEIAITLQEQITGMMFRTNLTDNDAMLFIFPKPAHQAFWNKNCDPLDLAYLDADGFIIDINTMNAGQTNLIASSANNIKYALETRGGWFKDHYFTPHMLCTTSEGSLQKTFHQ